MQARFVFAFDFFFPCIVWIGKPLTTLVIEWRGAGIVLQKTQIGCSENDSNVPPCTPCGRGRGRGTSTGASKQVEFGVGSTTITEKVRRICHPLPWNSSIRVQWYSLHIVIMQHACINS